VAASSATCGAVVQPAAASAPVTKKESATGTTRRCIAAVYMDTDA
jgi:hypothetical protein